MRHELAESVLYALASGRDGSYRNRLLKGGTNILFSFTLFLVIHGL